MVSSRSVAVTMIISWLGFFPTPRAFADSTVIPVTYQVPVSKELAKYAIFDGVRLTLTKSVAGDTQLEYELPEDLVGPGLVQISMQSNGGSPASSVIPSQLSGALASASCFEFPQTAQAMCKVRYRSGYTGAASEAQVSQFLSLKYKANPDLLRGRLLVLTQFFATPEGTLLIPLR
jgi:hypothetical protein